MKRYRVGNAFNESVRLERQEEVERGSSAARNKQLDTDKGNSKSLSLLEQYFVVVVSAFCLFACVSIITLLEIRSLRSKVRVLKVKVADLEVAQQDLNLDTIKLSKRASNLATAVREINQSVRELQ